MSQLRADLWCSAFVRRLNDMGTMCVVARRGDPIAGQIWIEIDHLDGTVSLYAPASTLAYMDSDEDRLFDVRLDSVAPDIIRDRLAREANFDPDFWLISVETRNRDIGIPRASKA